VVEVGDIRGIGERNIRVPYIFTSHYIVEHKGLEHIPV
jgi:hypothetical protein